MNGMQWALLLKPFGIFLFMVILVLPIKLLIDRAMKDSPIKRILFKRIN